MILASGTRMHLSATARPLLLLWPLLGAACQHGASTEDRAATGMSGLDGLSSDVTATGMPACPLAATGAPGSRRCRSARTYLECKGSDGGAQLCLSDDPSQCPGPNPVVGVTYSDCMNQCRPDEYGAACGPGPAAVPDPPAGCRLLPPNPGGGWTACCPCGP
jgi:hypothetical protein